MEKASEELQQLLEIEEPLLQLYDRLVRSASGRGEKELTRRMLQSQRFQISTLKVLVEGKIPDKFLYFGVITHNEVNVRESAAARSRSLTLVNPGTPVIAKENQGNWVCIQLPDGRSGWVFKDYIRRELSVD
ncbi:MAG: SH3 domain-containing protein [Bacillota bacterium]